MPVVAVPFVLVACGNQPEGTSSASGRWAVEREETAPVSRAVEALEVTRASLLRSIEASGIVEGVNEATVVAETQGILRFVSIELGAFVEAGTPIAGVDDTVAELAFEEAKQAYESAQLDLSATGRRFEAGSASQAELTRARSAANGARSRLEAAEKRFQDQTITAPISGYVAEIGDGVTIGNYIRQGVSVARIVDLSALRMEIAVGEQELQFLSTGAPARVTVPTLSPEPVPASVRSIAAGADSRTGSFRVVLEWENTFGEVMRSGLSASATIEPTDVSREIIVPASVVRTDREGPYVFVVEGGAVAVRRVRLGRKLGGRVQVLDGLDVGDSVVISALTSLEDGDPVTATVTGTTGGSL